MGNLTFSALLNQYLYYYQNQKMRKSINKPTFFLLLLLSFVFIENKAQTVEWLKGFDPGFAVYESATDPAGNVYSTGSFVGPISVGSYTFDSNDITSLLTKTDPSGNIVFAQQYCTPAMTGTTINEGWQICTDASGNIYIGGVFGATCVFGSYTLTAPSSSDAVYVLKMSPSGTILWVKQFAGSLSFYLTDMCIDSQNNLNICGGILGTVTFGSYIFSSSAGTSGPRDIVLFQMNSNDGNVNWAKQYGNTYDAISNCISAGNNNDLYMSGRFIGPLSFGSTTLIPVAGSRDIFISKMNIINGNVFWAKNFGGAGSDVPSDIAVNNQGKISLTGTMSVPATFGSKTFTSGNTFIVNTDTSGIIIWGDAFVGPDITNDFVAIDGAGNSYVSSKFTNTVALGTNSTTAVTATASSNATSKHTILLTKFDAAGNFGWLKQMGYKNYQHHSESMEYHSSNKIYLGGIAQDTTKIDTYSLTIGGHFLMKISTVPVGIEKISNSFESVSIYPNPTNDVLYIQIKENENDVLCLLLTDVFGKEIIKKNIDKNKDECLNTSGLLPGIYFLEIKGKEKSAVRKIIVN